MPAGGPISGGDPQSAPRAKALSNLRQDVMTDKRDPKGLSRRQLSQLGAATAGSLILGGASADAAAPERFDRRRELVARHRSC